MEMAFGLSCCSAALIVVSPLAATDNATAVIVSFTYFMVSSRVVDWWLHNTQTLGVFRCEICPDCHSRLDQARPGNDPFPTLPARGGGWEREMDQRSSPRVTSKSVDQLH